jgi:predicted nucleic acid-binding protein
MIYLDTSVALAQLLSEDRVPPESIWKGSLISSRLLEYELWTRIHALRLLKSHGEAVRLLLSSVALVELARPILTRALEPFPLPMRTLDALHLATVDFLRRQGQTIRVATYDRRLARVARRMRIPLFKL